MRPQPNWTRARAADRPTKRKKRDFDEQNAIAASVILADTTKHSAFQVRWAHAFSRRRNEERTERKVDTNTQTAQPGQD